MTQKAAFASGVPPDIYAFHRSTGNSAFLNHPQAVQFRKPFHGRAMGFHFRLALPPTHPLRPVIPSNVSPLRITAAAGT